ncbi:alpha-(1-_3)-arabinofuranosyltransferase family protein [Pedococcus sp. NPDC057267]|uniref:alpha-(1->3)-arabinofuranosyltransferase domain-containing protein n=1 Tax=Pedococcus sp. NPDC057267 TaxID=3346077 RepID=UPI00363BD1BC
MVWRARLLAGCLLLAAVAFHQEPGRIVPDTKLDLTANPGGFLLRALHMWDPQGAFGQLQNQAYGYLFPVGPFHWLLVTAGVPAWVVQRLWWTVVLGTAFVGMWRLATALRMGTPWSRYAGALVFALSPRFLGEVAVTSVEVWPLAMAPWVLLPLVDPRPRSWWWRTTASAVAFGFVGGVNAVATGATLVLPALWFLSRGLRARTVGLALGWLTAVVAVSVWWLVPLVLLGRYSPPFLDWIENAPVTTAFASPFEALRGTTPWLAFLTGPAGPSWPGMWLLVSTGALIAVTAAVAVLGLLGLASRSCPERRFLGLGLVVGLALVTLGHTGAAQSLAAGPLQAALDGALAPLRNTHKFELVVRVPLVLGLVHLGAHASRLSSRLRTPAWLVPVVTVSLLLASATPALLGSLARPEGYSAIPAHWRQAARWLDAQPGEGTVLVVPAASFADFTWGSTKDEPLQALMRRPFAVRDAVPLGSAGATRFLDGVEADLGAGRGGPELADALRSAGVRYLVVRNDLRADATRNVRALVHQALSRSGMPVVASFGPRVNPFAEQPGSTQESHTRLPYPSVEVVDTGATGEAVQAPVGAVGRVVGGPEDVGAVLAAHPELAMTVTGSDGVGAGSSLAASPSVVTDGYRRREVFFGRASDNTSPVLTPDDKGRTGRRVIDYDVAPSVTQTVRAWDGDLARVTASSSAADADATLRLGPGTGPAAAVDGDPATAWVSGRYGSAVGEWLELDLRSPRDVSGAEITFTHRDPLGAVPVEVQVESDRGRTTAVVAQSDRPQPLPVPAGTTGRLRVTVTKVAPGEPVNGVGIAEVSVPGLVLGSSLVAPAPRAGTIGSLLLRAAQGTSACVDIGSRPLCDPDLARDPEEVAGLHRSVDAGGAGDLAMSGAVVAVDGTAADGLLDGLNPVRATASSRAVADPAGRPGAAVDGDLGTGWVASADDPEPRLTVRLPRTVRSDGLQLRVDQYLAASRPTKVEVTLDGGRPRVLDVDRESRLSWPKQPVRTVVLRFLETSGARTIDANGLSRTLPVGVSEVVVSGAEGLVRKLSGDEGTGASCGFGPRLSVAGRGYDTAVTGTAAAVLQGRPLTWSLCRADAVAVPDGRFRLDAPATRVFRPVELSLATGGRALSSVTGSAGPTSDPAGTVRAVPQRTGPSTFTVALSGQPGASVLAVPQNFNPGWRATDQHGRVLSAVRVNGWQQGWVLPAGDAGTLHASFEPDRTYRLGLAIGALLALGVAALMLAARRRRGPAPPAPDESRVWGWGASAVLVAAFGWVGLAAVAVAVVVRRAAGRRLVVLSVVAAAGVLATAVAMVEPWPSGDAGVHSSVVQLAVLTAVALALSVTWAGTRSPRRARRMSGRSTP